MSAAKVIAVCGKICSGKTCYARRLTQGGNAIILSCDELTYALFDNDLGDRHDEMSARIWAYFKTKASELVRAGCTVILDWGFWRKADRLSLTEYFSAQDIPLEWHYVEVDDRTWYRNIEERNHRVLSGEGGSDYYLDEGLMQKLLLKWEAPSRDEVDVVYHITRE